MRFRNQDLESQLTLTCARAASASSPEIAMSRTLSPRTNRLRSLPRALSSDELWNASAFPFLPIRHNRATRRESKGEAPMHAAVSPYISPRLQFTPGLKESSPSRSATSAPIRSSSIRRCTSANSSSKPSKADRSETTASSKDRGSRAALDRALPRSRWSQVRVGQIGYRAGASFTANVISFPPRCTVTSTVSPGWLPRVDAM